MKIRCMDYLVVPHALFLELCLSHRRRNLINRFKVFESVFLVNDLSRLVEGGCFVPAENNNKYCYPFIQSCTFKLLDNF
jgi:hypothetical protein